MKNIFQKKQAAPKNRIEEILDQTLLEMPGTKEIITWADSVEGSLILGATGSGKSSGPGRHLALAMLKSGYGFCILCVKSDESKRFQDYIRKEAPEREKDIIVFNKTSGLKFNFLKYEMDREGEGAGEIINSANALMSLNEQTRIHLSGGSSGNDERFWDNALRRLINRTISLLRLTGEEVSISNMRRIVSKCFDRDTVQLYELLIKTANANDETDPQKKQKAKSDLSLWAKADFFLSTIIKLRNPEFAGDQEVRGIVDDYWMHEFALLSERPRSIVVESFLGIIDPFLNNGILKNQFSGGHSSELEPESIYLNNKIVIVDFSVKEFGLAGILASTIYKTSFQAAMERRVIQSEDDPKPVALWIDEYQNLCSPMYDSLFQLTARSSMVASVFITQNINNLIFVMGNNQPEAKAKSLLSNLNLKIFASNSDVETNQWAAEIIGKELTLFQNVNYDKDKQLSKSKNQQMYFRLSPDDFTKLKTGRSANNNIVEAVVFKPGKYWGTEKENFAVIEFEQG
ncbi:MAG: TraM recognition domain-containing protein [Marinoscillum sp.]